MQGRNVPIPRYHLLFPISCRELEKSLSGCVLSLTFGGDTPIATGEERAGFQAQPGACVEFLYIALAMFVDACTRSTRAMKIHQFTRWWQSQAD